MPECRPTFIVDIVITATYFETPKGSICPEPRCLGNRTAALGPIKEVLKKDGLLVLFGDSDGKVRKAQAIPHASFSPQSGGRVGDPPLMKFVVGLGVGRISLRRPPPCEAEQLPAKEAQTLALEVYLHVRDALKQAPFFAELRDAQRAELEKLFADAPADRPPRGGVRGLRSDATTPVADLAGKGADRGRGDLDDLVEARPAPVDAADCRWPGWGDQLRTLFSKTERCVLLPLPEPILHL